MAKKKFLRRKIFVIQGLAFLLLIIFFIITYLPFSNNECKSLNEYKNLYINGRVINKYIDSTQHSYPIIVISNNIITTQKLNLVFDTTNSYSLINIGDSLLKKKGQLLLLIEKGGEVIEKNIDFGCHTYDPPPPISNIE